MKSQTEGKEIKHLELTQEFHNNHLEYILGDNVRLDLVRIVMKINEIINKLNSKND